MALSDQAITFSIGVTGADAAAGELKKVGQAAQQTGQQINTVTTSGGGGSIAGTFGRGFLGGALGKIVAPELKGVEMGLRQINAEGGFTAANMAKLGAVTVGAGFALYQMGESSKKAWLEVTGGAERAFAAFAKSNLGSSSAQIIGNISAMSREVENFKRASEEALKPTIGNLIGGGVGMLTGGASLQEKQAEAALKESQARNRIAAAAAVAVSEALREQSILALNLDGRKQEAAQLQRTLDLERAIARVMATDIPTASKKQIEDILRQNSALEEQAAILAKRNRAAFDAQEEEKQWREGLAKEDAEFDREKDARRKADAAAAFDAFEDFARKQSQLNRENAAEDAAVRKAAAEAAAQARVEAEKRAQEEIEGFNRRLDAEKAGIHETPQQRSDRLQGERRAAQDERIVLEREAARQEREQGVDRLPPSQRGDARARIRENIARMRGGGAPLAAEEAALVPPVTDLAGNVAERAGADLSGLAAGGKPPGYVDFFNLDGKTGGGDATAAMQPATQSADTLNQTTATAAANIAASLAAAGASIDGLPGAFAAFAARIAAVEASVRALASEGG